MRDCHHAPQSRDRIANRLVGGKHQPYSEEPNLRNLLESAHGPEAPRPTPEPRGRHGVASREPERRTTRDRGSPILCRYRAALPRSKGSRAEPASGIATTAPWFDRNGRGAAARASRVGSSAGMSSRLPEHPSDATQEALRHRTSSPRERRQVGQAPDFPAPSHDPETNRSPAHSW